MYGPVIQDENSGASLNKLKADGFVVVLAGGRVKEFVDFSLLPELPLTSALLCSKDGKVCIPFPAC